ncbi:MAG: NAD(P)-binding domain-containing protein [bacterium]|nr:NAD(P)-binding domain-containing protein [bacterium]
MEKIAIIGVGNFGSAIAHLLASLHCPVSLWDSDTKKVPEQLTLAETVQGASIIFLCVSSWSLREAAVSLLQYISEGAIIICPTKGIEEKTLKTSDEVLQDVFRGKAVVSLLHGPMLAAEIMQNLPAFSVLAVPSREIFDRVVAVFSGSALRLEYSSDVHGVALAGVLKNIYSIGLGMTSALALGSNFRGWFVQVALEEMNTIITGLGGNSATAYTSAGIADMIATGFSPYSRNCKVGQEIVQNGECVTVSEGAESLPQMVKLLKQASVPAPIVVLIGKIVAGEGSAHTIDTIMSYPSQ